MKYSVLFLVLLLPACASIHRAGGATGGATVAVPEHRNAEPQSAAPKPAATRPAAPKPAAPKPAASQRSVLIEVQQPVLIEVSLPVSSVQPNPPRKKHKHKHNIEED